MIEFDQKKLAKLREAAGLTPTGLAIKVHERTGIIMAADTLRNYERKVAPVQFSVLAAIAKVLGVPMEDLFKNGRKRRTKS